MVSIVVVPSSTAEGTRQAADRRSQTVTIPWAATVRVRVRLGTTRCSTMGYRSTGDGVRQAGRDTLCARLIMYV